MVRTTIIAAGLAAFLVMGCGGNKQAKTPESGTMTKNGAVSAQSQQTPAGEAAVGQMGTPPPAGVDTVTTESGLRYVVIKPGTGASPQSGQTVNVHYTGWLTNGNKFDSSKDRNQPFSFPIGQGRVIKGWDEGVMMMKIGEIRKLIIPPQLAYGERSPSPLIPPNSTLVFEVELLEIK